MKTETHEEISFTNCHAGLHLSKKEGAVAVDFKSSEIVLYLNTSLYQALAWLLYTASDCKELVGFTSWAVDPKLTSKSSLIELHGPEHAVCLICVPSQERVQLNFEIGVSIDLKFSDFNGLVELVKEAQNDLEWRRNLLQWTYKQDIRQDNYRNNRDNKDKKAI